MLKHKLDEKFVSKSRKTKRNSSNDRSSHPSHLRGKEIGMFYAERSRARKKAEENKPTRPIGTVVLSDDKKEQIRKLLYKSEKHINVPNHSFRKSFEKFVTGSIEEKLNKSFDTIERNLFLDEKLQREFQLRTQSLHYQSMLRKRLQLPSYKKKLHILNMIHMNQAIVISGETGCGKTTQVAQFILDDYLENGVGSLCNIICTQPRRISAISVAERVADERAEPLGISVGYHIRLEKKMPRQKGSILFCTTGVVLKIMESDPCLSGVSHVILDEIHERDIMSDFLLALLKHVLLKRNDLKVILMSATLNSEKFSRYYNDCPHINIPGFTYPVQEYYLEDVLERTGFVLNTSGQNRQQGKFKTDSFYLNFMDAYLRSDETIGRYSSTVRKQLENPQIEKTNPDLIMALVVNICETENEGAILIFLTGYSEISQLVRLMTNSGKFPSNKFKIIPLHSQMPTVNQKEIFECVPNGVRKIIVSTNIAETSVTIDDVVFVIDCGKMKMTNFDVETKTQTLKPEWVSLANATQRKGRAGRVRPGKCFHLFSRAREMILQKYLKPEILRSRLENTILTIKILQLGDIQPFFNCLMDSPNADAVVVSIELLKRLNALDNNETLTPLGYHLAKLPMAPQMGKMILLGVIFSCLDPVLSVAASLDFKDAFQTPLGKEYEVSRKKLNLSEGWKSDHLLLHQLLRKFEKVDRCEVKQFCWDHFLNFHTLIQLQDMKVQFMEYLYEMNFVGSKNPKNSNCNKNSKNFSLVKAIVCAGLYPNIGTIRKMKHTKLINTIEGEKAKLHPRSILCYENRIESPLFVYYLKLRSTANFIHDATLVHPFPLIFFGDNYKYNCVGNESTISIGCDKLKFKCTHNTYLIIKQLRDKLNCFLECKLSNPGIINWEKNGEETKVLRAVIELITDEDMDSTVTIN